MSLGEVAEWSIAAVLKTVELRGSGGSNPSLSARLRRKKVSRNRYLLFFIPWHKFTCRQRHIKQKIQLAAFCAVGLQGPLRRAEGKGVKRSDHQERSSQSLPLRKITKQNGRLKGRPFCFCVCVSESELSPQPQKQNCLQQCSALFAHSELLLT